MPKLTAVEILAPIAPDMEAVNSIIRQHLSSDVILINQLAEHIIGSGGKRLRPALAVLSAKTLGYQGEKHYLLAAIIEFIHTATLLHDDVVDHSDLRRGQATANAMWGNEASVLTGDFLYSRAFQLMMKLEEPAVLSILADTTNRIAEGEVLQLMNVNNPDISEKTYYDVIERKTAILFEAAARCAAIVAGSDSATVSSLGDYGHHLGMAFQLIDDCLDYEQDAETIGKNIGDDLAEGKTTLPVIIAMQRGSDEQRKVLQHAIRNGSVDELGKVQQAIVDSQAISYTKAQAEKASESAAAALQNLPDSACKTALVQLAAFAADRQY